MINRRARAIPYRNPHNTSDALLISGVILAAGAFFWWLNRRIAKTNATTQIGLDSGLDFLGAK